MTTDRTEELIRAMLERRTSVPPTSLAREAMQAVATARQRRGRRLQDAPAARVAVVAATAVLLVVHCRLALGDSRLGSWGSPGGRVPRPLRFLVPPQSSAPIASAATPTERRSRIAAGDEPASIAAPSVVGSPRTRSPWSPTAGDRSASAPDPASAQTRSACSRCWAQGPGCWCVDGPVEADGYLTGTRCSRRTGLGLAGWVAKGNADASWLRVARTRMSRTADAGALCVTPPSIDLPASCYRP